MGRACPLLIGAVLVITALVAAPAEAQQILGTARWQIVPLCDVFELTVVQFGPVFLVVGFNLNCGAAVRTGLIGNAFRNPNGTLGMTILDTFPDGHATNYIILPNLPDLNGTWANNFGSSGTFEFLGPVP